MALGTLADLLALLQAEDPMPELDRHAAELAALLECRPNRERLAALVAIETGQLFEWDAERRLLALLPDDAVSIAAVAARLGAPAALRDRFAAAAAAGGTPVRIVSWLSPREIRRAIYRLGAQAFCDRVLLAWAAAPRTAAVPQWRLLLVYPGTWIVPEFPIGQSELRAAGILPGPLADQVLQEVEAWWIDLDFTDDRMAAVERLKAVIQGLA
jgi:poly(A) polymerase